MIPFDPTHPDAMLHEYFARREAGEVSAHERAMSALERATQAGAILTGDTENVSADRKREVLAQVERVAIVAALCAQAKDRGWEAGDLALIAEREAAKVDDFDKARFADLPRSSPGCNKHLRGR